MIAALLIFALLAWLTLCFIAFELYVLYRAVIRRPIMKPKPKPEHRPADLEHDQILRRATGDNLIPL